MKFIKLLFFYFAIIHYLYADDIKIIELHNQTFDQLIQNNDVQINKNEESSESLSDDVNQASDDLLNSDNSEDLIIDSNTEDLIIDSNTEDLIIDSNSIENNLDEEIIALPDFWENADSDELIFLFDNMIPTYSVALNNLLINSLTINSLPPQNFTEEEFNNIRIVNLIKLGKRKKAFDMINNIENNQYHLDLYDFFKLMYFFSTNELNQACEFNKLVDRKKSSIEANLLLKVDIFCEFINNKVDEAEFLNSLLLDINDQDEYFQKIFLNLKNSIKDQIDTNLYNYEKNTMPLYSAMIRVGDMPLNKLFLENDSINLSMPIVLSGSSDIPLRLYAAHQAYKQGVFNAESLSALYQTVDFSYEELSNTDFTTNNFNNEVEIGMAYLFQKANIQLLPITRLQTLIDFWNFAESHGLNLLAYDISSNLINTIEPLPELSDFGIQISKAHIYNENFELADKWILFTENYKSEKINIEEQIKSIRLLYDLKKSNNDNQFIDILIKSDLFKQDSQDASKQEILLTILSAINNNSEKKFKGHRTLIDTRPMPSQYLLNKIKNSSVENNFGELILSINISMINKYWTEIHPEHLKIILIAFRDLKTEGIFKTIILEILEESKII